MGFNLEGPEHPIGRKDLSLAGALIVLSQVFSSVQSSQNISTELSHFKDEFRESLLEREKYFVRKSDLQSLLVKLDSMNEQLTKVNEQLNNLRTYVRENVSYEFPIIGCSVQEADELFHDI